MVRLWSDQPDGIVNGHNVSVNINEGYHTFNAAISSVPIIGGLFNAVSSIFGTGDSITWIDIGSVRLTFTQAYVLFNKLGLERDFSGDFFSFQVNIGKAKRIFEEQLPNLFNSWYDYATYILELSPGLFTLEITDDSSGNVFKMGNSSTPVFMGGILLILILILRKNE